MWDYDGFIGKAQLYFSRAQKHSRATDTDVLALWLLLGLEFLLRAPLAKVSPTLLADPTGDSVMHAAGFAPPNAQLPKSIQTRTVLSRLAVVIPDFTKERHDDATLLVGLRNGELHTSTSSLELDEARWLPRFTRVLEVLCRHLALDPSDLIGSDLIEHGRALVDTEDKNIGYEISQRIEGAKRFVSQLRSDERATRQGAIPKPAPTIAGSPTATETVPCPACRARIPMRLRAVRSTNDRIEDDEIYRDTVYIATGLECPVCDLVLNNTAHIRSAGLQQQYVRAERDSIEDRFLSNYEPDDYGND
jgi:hypothetical protein